MVGEVVLVALMMTTVPVAACPPEMALDVLAEHHPPTVRSSYNLDQIREFATHMGRPAKHEPLGFYASIFGYTVDVQQTAVGMPGCKPAVAARVRLILGGRLVEIGADLQSHGCQRNVILSHYMLHAQYDDEALSAYANRAMDALGKISTTELLGNQAQGSLVDNAAESIRRTMDKVLLSYDNVRAEAMALADNPEELNKLTNACRRTL